MRPKMSAYNFSENKTKMYAFEFSENKIKMNFIPRENESLGSKLLPKLFLGKE